jgi:hypothetical protein
LAKVAKIAMVGKGTVWSKQKLGDRIKRSKNFTLLLQPKVFYQRFKIIVEMPIKGKPI